jgi:CheY-like chemotaxis protein/HPt (histidine-containing phosphotransfer) domain-containing protein
MTRSSSFDSEISRILKKHSPTLPVVHLVSRRIGDIPANELTVSANPLLFDELANMLVIASRKGEVRDVVQKSERRSRVRKLVPSMEEAVARNELILVAEDNDVSREVIQEQLRILGYASVVAEDGQAALEKWRSGHFSLLLTDCHMPYLDGFGLTAAIRKEEHSEKRLRIIAVTGNAMQGEAQRCIACGMDDYLAKPLRLSDLGAKLARWLPQKELEVSPAPVSTARQATVTAPANSDHDALWDNGTLTRMVGDNPDMHRRLLNKFVSGTEEHIAAIMSAAAAGDLDTVSGIAHKMKSAARTVGALRLGNICQKLEVSAKLRDANVVATCTAELASGFSEVTSVINKLN